MIRRAALVLALLTLAACTKEPVKPVKPAETIPAPKFLNVMTADACGTQCVPKVTAEDWAVDLVKQVDRLEMDVFMLQQVCKAQYMGLDKQLSRRTEGRGAYTIIWQTTVENSKLCTRWGKTADPKDANHYGLMIAVRGLRAISNQNHVELPNDGKHEPRVLLCGDARVAGQTARVCTVNLDPDPKIVDSQVVNAAQFLNEWAQQRPVIVGGNFNVRPSRESILSVYAQPHGKGLFEEVDYADKQFYGTKCPRSAPRCVSGVPTTYSDKAKVDYLFLSDSHFDVVGGGVDRDVLPDARHLALMVTLLPAGAQS